jgi:hypothetical protein
MKRDGIGNFPVKFIILSLKETKLSRQRNVLFLTIFFYLRKRLRRFYGILFLAFQN